MKDEADKVFWVCQDDCGYVEDMYASVYDEDSEEGPNKHRWWEMYLGKQSDALMYNAKTLSRITDYTYFMSLTKEGVRKKTNSTEGQVKKSGRKRKRLNLYKYDSKSKTKPE